MKQLPQQARSASCPSSQISRPAYMDWLWAVAKLGNSPVERKYACQVLCRIGEIEQHRQTLAELAQKLVDEMAERSAR